MEELLVHFSNYKYREHPGRGWSLQRPCHGSASTVNYDVIKAPWYIVDKGQIHLDYPDISATLHSLLGAGIDIA